MVGNTGVRLPSPPQLNLNNGNQISSVVEHSTVKRREVTSSILVSGSINLNNNDINPERMLEGIIIMLLLFLFFFLFFNSIEKEKKELKKNSKVKDHSKYKAKIKPVQKKIASSDYEIIDTINNL